MIQGKWFSPGADISEALEIRNAVFGETGEETDMQGWNVLIFNNDLPVATGRIWWSDGSFWLGKICVIKEYRGLGLGDLALRLLLFKAQSHSASEVRLVSPEDLTGFFSRLGFQPSGISGSGVEMSIRGSDIDLDTCRNCRKQNCTNRH